MAIADSKGKVLFLTDAYVGSVHDKVVWDDLVIHPGAITLLADLGFLGIEKEHSTIILPYKKPNGRDLSDLKKKINQGISRARVIVEHAFAGIKRLKIIRNKIRLKSYEMRNAVMRIAAGLHNLRVQYRKDIGNES